jgi:hypothetical protein
MSRLGWALLNALQLLFTLLWTAGWICLALVVHLLTGGRHWSLRMASRCWHPGCCMVPARGWTCAGWSGSTGRSRTCSSPTTSR